PANSVAVLVEAGRGATPSETTPVVLADAGVENVNAQVDDLITTGVLRRVLAFTELKFSNSMIEAWWRSLKHQWLFLHSLDSVTTVRRLVEFYVQEHNRLLPHSAFRGQTPDEMYFYEAACQLPWMVSTERPSSGHTSIHRARVQYVRERSKSTARRQALASQREVGPTFIRALSVAPQVPAHEMIRGRSSAFFGAALTGGQVHLRACSSSLTTASVQNYTGAGCVPATG